MTENNIPQNVKLANEEMVPRAEKAIITLIGLIADTDNVENQERLENKANGVRLVLEAHREQLQNLKTTTDIIILATLIEEGMEDKVREGTQLMKSYLLEYARI